MASSFSFPPEIVPCYIPHAETDCVNNSSDEDEGSVITGAGGDMYYMSLEEACAQPGVKAVSAVSFSNRHDVYSCYFSRLAGVYSVATKVWHPVSDETRCEDTLAAFAAVGIVHTNSITNAGASKASILLLDMQTPDVSWHSMRVLYKRLCDQQQGVANVKQRDVWARHLRAAIDDKDWSLAQRMHQLSKRHFINVLSDVLLDCSSAAQRIMCRHLRLASVWKAARSVL